MTDALNFKIDGDQVIWEDGGRISKATARERALWQEIERLRWALHCCETSLSTYDEGANAEYWVRKRDDFT